MSSHNDQSPIVIAGFSISLVLHAAAISLFAVADPNASSVLRTSTDRMRDTGPLMVLAPLENANPEPVPPPEPEPERLPEPVPEPLPEPAPEPEEILIRPGIDRSSADTPTWLGFEVPTEHFAPMGSIEQSALSPAPGLPGPVGSPNPMQQMAQGEEARRAAEATPQVPQQEPGPTEQPPQENPQSQAREPSAQPEMPPAIESTSPPALATKLDSPALEELGGKGDGLVLAPETKLKVGENKPLDGAGVDPLSPAGKLAEEAGKQVAESQSVEKPKESIQGVVGVDPQSTRRETLPEKTPDQTEFPREGPEEGLEEIVPTSRGVVLPDEVAKPDGDLTSLERETKVLTSAQALPEPSPMPSEATAPKGGTGPAMKVEAIDVDDKAQDGTTDPSAFAEDAAESLKKFLEAAPALTTGPMLPVRDNPLLRMERATMTPPQEAATMVPAVNAPAGVPQSGKTQGEESDAESEASGLDQVVTVKPGRVVAAQGLRIRTVRPEWPLMARLASAPKPVVVRVVFGRSGRVVEANFVDDEGTGYIDLDTPIIDAVYRWSAIGEDLKKASGEDPKRGVVLRFRIVLRENIGP